MAKKRIATEWCVMEGEPSWHQRRAGHTHAAITCYWSKKDAVAYMKRIKRKRPNESLRLMSERKFRFYP